MKKHTIEMCKTEEGWIQVIVNDNVEGFTGDAFEFNPNRFDSIQWAANYLQTQYKIRSATFFDMFEKVNK